MSITSGLRSGLLSGLRSGLNPALGIDSDIDTLAQKYVPSTSAQWASVLNASGISAANTPMSLWSMQQSSGDIIDDIGTVDLTNVLMTYETAQTGWTRKGMSAPDLNGAYFLFNNSDSSLPDPSAESVLLLMYVAITATPAGDRCAAVITQGGASYTRGLVTSSNYPKIHNGTNTGTGGSSLTTAVRPWVIQHNVTASSSELFTDLEKVSATFAASLNTKLVFFGGAIEGAPGMNVLYGALFKGAAAELTDAQIRTLLQTLGWTISW